jgi:hypothetical protein
MHPPLVGFIAAMEELKLKGPVGSRVTFDISNPTELVA